LMRIRILLLTLTRIRIHLFILIRDPASKNDADPTLVKGI
jgi:hypothetical protein